MASSLIGLFLLLGISRTAFSTDEPPQRVDISVAINEMQVAKYYTFVTLVQMLRNNITGNATFLMPSDRILSRTPVSQNAVYKFVFSHVIPAPLAYSNIKGFPSGSLIPSCYPHYRIRTSTHRKTVFLNAIKIVRPNVCTAGSTIRCHGIDGVFELSDESNIRRPNLPPPPPTPTPLPHSASMQPPPTTQIESKPGLPLVSAPTAAQEGAPSPMSSNLLVPKSASLTLIAVPGALRRASILMACILSIWFLRL